MKLLKNHSIKLFVVIITFLLFLKPSLAEEEEKNINAIADQIQVIMSDIETLEKAVYKKSDITSSSSSSSGANEEVLTRHLLKLNEIEDQFRKLTNRFEEINFKLDKLSSRVTKIQSDTQLRFSDIESVSTNDKKTKIKNKLTKKNKLNYQVLIRHKILVARLVMI